MVIEDYPTCLAVTNWPYESTAIGLETLCGFERHGRVWRRSSASDETSSVGVSLSEVLVEVGMTMQRYDRYLQLLSDFEAERIVFGAETNGSFALELSVDEWTWFVTSYHVYLSRYTISQDQLVENAFENEVSVGSKCSPLGDGWSACLSVR